MFGGRIIPSSALPLTGVLSHSGLILVVTPNSRTLVVITQFLPVILNQMRGKVQCGKIGPRWLDRMEAKKMDRSCW